MLVALAASAALLYDYTRPLPAFCQSGGGCDAVRHSQFAYVLGVPQPIIGLFAFVVLLGGSFRPHAWRAAYLTPIATLGGILGVAFLAIQAFKIGAFCNLCLVVDSASIALAMLAWLHRASPTGTDGALSTTSWGVLALVAVSAPLIFAQLRPVPPVPVAVAKLWSPGHLNIVELSDFECPFCRLLHASLKSVLASYGDRVNLVRVTTPLPGHKNARIASRAYLCAKAQGKGEDMADALFVNDDISDLGCRAISASLAGLDRPAFDACYVAPSSDALVEAELRRAKEIGYKGLPTMWVGTELLLGNRSPEDLRAAIDGGLNGNRGSGPNIPQSWLWGGLCVLFAATAGFAAFSKGASNSSAESG